MLKVDRDEVANAHVAVVAELLSKFIPTSKSLNTIKLYFRVLILLWHGMSVSSQWHMEGTPA